MGDAVSILGTSVTSSRVFTLKGIENVCLSYIYLDTVFNQKYSFFLTDAIKAYIFTVVVLLTMMTERNRLIYILFWLLP